MEAAELSERVFPGSRHRSRVQRGPGESGIEATYGRLLGAHRHRRNRPCTYPNCQLSAHVHSVAVPRAQLARALGCGFEGMRALLGRTAPPPQGWRVFAMGGHSHSPIVDDEGCDFLCRDTGRLAELIEIEGEAGGDGQPTGQ